MRAARCGAARCGAARWGAARCGATRDCAGRLAGEALCGFPLLSCCCCAENSVVADLACAALAAQGATRKVAAKRPAEKSGNPILMITTGPPTPNGMRGQVPSVLKVPSKPKLDRSQIQKRPPLHRSKSQKGKPRNRSNWDNPNAISVYVSFLEGGRAASDRNVRFGPKADIRGRRMLRG